MRARLLRLMTAAAVSGCLLAASNGPAAASAADDAPRTLRVEVLDTETHGLDRLISLAGAPHRVDVAVRVTNVGTRVERDVVARVETPASVAVTTPVDLAPGHSMRSVVAVTVSGPPGSARDIVVSAGDTSVGVAHVQAPWLLLGACALGLHVIALGVRDRLRARIARGGGLQTDQPSPSHTWARSSRYSDTS